MSASRTSRSIRVLQLAGFAEWGGTGMQLMALASGLAAKGHHPVVAAPLDSQVLDKARQAGVEAAPLPSGWLGRGAALRRLLAQGRFDLGHAHDAKSLGWLASADRGEPRLPIALSVGGAAEDGARLLSRGAPVSRVGQFFAASEWSWSALVREGIEESRIAVNHTAIDLARFRPDVAASPTAFHDDDFVVGWVGRLDRRSGVEVLLEAARQIRAGVPPPGETRIRVLIVGEGPERAALQRSASKSGIDDAAAFTGWRDDVPGLMAAMDVYAHPATSGDGFPVPLREAMAVGVPVVATDLTGMREILDNGKHGLIAPAGDAAALALNIMRLRRDPAFAAQLGKAGQLKVQRYGIQAMVDRAEELYFRLIR